MSFSISSSQSTGVVTELTFKQRPWRSVSIISTVIHLALVLVALMPLDPIYDSGRMWMVATVAAVISATVTLVSVLRGWHMLVYLAVWLFTFVMAGVVALPSYADFGFLPGPEYLHQFGRGIFQVWKQVLTVEPPFHDLETALLLPFLLAWIGAGVATYLCCNSKRYPYSGVALAVLLLVAILFGGHEVRGVTLVALATVIGYLGWYSWRSHRLQPGRILALAVLGLISTVLVVWTSAVNPSPEDRIVLRDYVQPPVTPVQYPSPLAGYREYTDLLSSSTLFELSQVPAGHERLRLATMDVYDGHTWSVSGQWQTIDDGFAYISRDIRSEPAQFTTTIHIHDYHKVWLPNVGGSVHVKFGGTRASLLQRSLFYHRGSDTGVVDQTLTSGDSYELSAIDNRPTLPSDTDLLSVADIEQAPSVEIPNAISERAAELLSSSDSVEMSDYAKIATLAGSLAGSGAFSHGLAGEMPSLPGHGLARLQAMASADVMVGDEEQYAALFALMIRSLGYPSRVVIGFELDQSASQDGVVSVRGDDVTAWVEVPFDGVGWVPFDPTPDPDQRPTVQRPEQVESPRPQVVQPPDPPNQSPAPVPAESEDSVAEENLADSPVSMYWVPVGIAAAVLFIILGILGAIIGLKGRRRRRRRTGDWREQTLGAWAEYEDALRDTGQAPPANLTRSQTAQGAGPGVQELAVAADRAQYSQQPISAQTAASSWQIYEEQVAQIFDELKLGARIRARLSIRSLRR